MATAKDYIGGKLYALTPVPVYNAGHTQLLRTLKPGQFVGVIDSWFTDEKGNVIWLINDYKESVKHAANVFDLPKLQQSITEKQSATQAEINAIVEQRKSQNTAPLYQAGKTTKQVAGGIGDAISNVGQGAVNASIVIKYLPFVVLILAVLFVYFNYIKK